MFSGFVVAKTTAVLSGLVLCCGALAANAFEINGVYEPPSVSLLALQAPEQNPAQRLVI
jgi:hypothetical protein